MQKIIKLKYLLFFTLFFIFGKSFSQAISEDTLLRKKQNTYFINWKDSYLNRFNYSQSPLLKLSPDSIKSNVLYNSAKNNFSLNEKLSQKIDTKLPQAMSFNEYSSIQNAMLRKSIMRDIEKAQDGNTSTSGKRLNPLTEKNPILDRLFGDKVPEFKPNGSIGFDLTAGYTFVNNPQVPISQRRQSAFNMPTPKIAIDFNSLFSGGGNESQEGQESDTQPPPQGQNNRLTDLNNILNKGQSIKEKLNILGNFDTQSSFGSENRFKINFKNEPEDILQKLEFGNVTMPNRSQLIPGVQNLVGIKAGLKFGKFDITTVIAQQKSRTESIVINGGSQSTPFEIKCDNYDENRHFFLSHFFRNNYEKSLKNLPILTSGVRITRIEVFITNRSNNFISMRNLVGLSDVGEKQPFKSDLIISNPNVLAADNNANNLFSKLVNNEPFRKIDNTSNVLKGIGLSSGDDFEILRGAKRLNDREFEFQPELGYISLFAPLRNDEVLAVAYEYTYQGRAYKVGEMTEDYVNRKEDEVIMLKLLKSSTIRNRLKNPMWDLMMKNVYTLAQGQVKREGFQLRIVYKDDQTGLDSPNLQEGKNLKNKPLIEALGLDKLNFNNDKLKNGNFDYVENVTINEKLGKIIFPVLEPFGSHLQKLFDPTETDLINKYVFDDLYRKTLVDAQQQNLKNKFFLSGSVRAGSSEISLPYGATGSSVRIYSGGSQLQQGTDFTVDEQLGRILITNQSILSSGRQIRIDYERADLFQAQVRRLFGLRIDYTLGRYLHLGATLMDLRENTPGRVTRTSIGNEPVNNTLWGIDANIKKDLYGLTKLLDALPGIQTKEMSSILFNAEFAQLRPGVNDKRVGGNSMIDDFEFARNINDLTRQSTKWRLGSSPGNVLDKTTDLNINPYAYNYKRAILSVYSIDPSSYGNVGFGGGLSVPEELTNEASQNIYTRGFRIQDIYPGRSVSNAFQLPSAILDMAYFPEEPGMYNYNADLTSDGLLKNPKENFGSVMRGITFDADFDNSNVEYLETWILDPFAAEVRDGRKNLKNSTGGKILIQLGDVSEDVIPDSRFNFENGIKQSLNGTSDPVITKWGYAPKSQFITDAFDNEESIRSKQDIGLDGLSNAQEANFTHIKDFLGNANIAVTNADAKKKLNEDPSKDDFRFFLDPIYNERKAGFLERFKNYMGMENNTPPIDNNANAQSLTNSQASTNQADKEDINQDNTINDIEDYHEYEIELKPSSLEVGNGYVVDKVSTNGATWYLMRIPIRKPTRSFPVGKEGFKSIRFLRLVTTDWEQPVVLRFAAMQLVSNQYRVYDKKISDKGAIEIPETDNSVIFKTASVNIEENGCSEDGKCEIKEGTIPYVVPPGFIRDQDYTSSQQRVQYNEQSLSLAVENLKGGESRAVFKNTKLDLNMYKRIKMFVHTQNKLNENKIASVFVRLGTDLKNNYYEIELPNLLTTTLGATDPNSIWPKENELDIPLDVLRKLKLERNKSSKPINKIFGGDKLVDIQGSVSGSQTSRRDEEDVITRQYKISVVGNPDLSNVLTVMVGLKNNDTLNANQGKNFTAWFDELRAYRFDQEPGEAAVMSADIKLADVATIMINGNFKNYGFGGVQDRISVRSRETNQGFGIASNIELDKFFPLKWGLAIPLFVNYDNQNIKPTFNPLDPDIRLEDAIANKGLFQQNLTSQIVEENTTTKGFNLTNIRKSKTKANAKNHFYDIENFTFSYAQNRIERHNVLIEENLQTQNRAGLSYQYQPKTFNWEPFKKSKRLSKPRYSWLKDFNLSPIPTLMSFRTDYDRSFIKTQYRNSNLGIQDISPNIIKYFIGNRVYDAQWNLTKSIVLTYNASMNSIQDDIDSITRNEIKFFDGLKTLGRAKNYEQKIQATYRLPLDKFFLLDWVKADSRYNNNYGFKAGSFQIKDENEDAFGNMLENGRELAINGQVDLVKLYNKLKVLRLANAPNAPVKKFTRAPGDDEEIKLPSNNVIKNLTRLLMTVRGINFNYALFETSMLPGFLPSPTFFGLDTKNDFAPGLEFVMGGQNRNIHKQSAQNGWLSESIIQNNPFIQTRGVKFDYNTSLEPFKGFRMQIKGNFTRGDSYQEMFKPETVNGKFTTLSPVRNGNFSMSFWSFKTSFEKISGDSSSLYQYKIFDNMVNNRQQVLNKLNKLNTNAEGVLIGKYDINSQDVLIPAFFAAYSGQSVDKIFEKSAKRGSKTFNPFLAFPMPNWRIDYQGLEKLPVFKRFFNSITISHSYMSTYSVGNFTSSLEYGSQVVNLLIKDYPLGDKTVNSGGTIPYLSQIPLFAPTYIMSSITMDEKFSPLIGVEFTTKKNFTGSFRWDKERKASLNLGNAQVAEYSNNDIRFGMGFKKNNVKLPIKGRDGNKIILKNDLNCRIDINSRDVKALQRRLDGDVTPVAPSNLDFSIRPQLQYQINKKINIGVYWEKRVNNPYTSQGFYSRSSIFGFNAKFNLSD
jgi:cell surface protein SprA